MNLKTLIRYTGLYHTSLTQQVLVAPNLHLGKHLVTVSVLICIISVLSWIHDYNMTWSFYNSYCSGVIYILVQ